jgi:hypothetical protein
VAARVNFVDDPHLDLLVEVLDKDVIMVLLISSGPNQLVKLLEVLFCRLRALSHLGKLIFGVWFFVLVAENCLTLRFEIGSASPVGFVWQGLSHRLRPRSPPPQVI